MSTTTVLKMNKFGMYHNVEIDDETGEEISTTEQKESLPFLKEEVKTPTKKG